MPRYEIQSPDGRRFEITAPEGATQDQVLEYARSQFAKEPTAPQAPFVPSGEQPAGSLLDPLKRQAGLTLRAGGPVAAGALAGGAAGSVLPGVGTAVGAGAGGLAMSILQLVDQLGGTDYIAQAMDRLGIPKPESSVEKIASGTAKTMASMGGIGGGAAALAPQAQGLSKGIFETLGKNLGTQTTAALSGGAAGETAKESGAGPWGQLAATVAGSIGAPLGVEGTKLAGRQLMDAISTIGAAFGYKPAVTRLASGIAQEFAGSDKGRIISALQSAKEFVPGAKPTVAEAIAGPQIGAPGQFGGSLVKLQKDLSGAKGVEDILPGAARSQQAAIRQHLDEVTKATLPLAEKALKAANIHGVRADVITREIDKMAVVPGQRASDVVQKSLAGVTEKLKSLTDAQGMVDARDLWTVRKEVGNLIKTHAKETANWDKRLTAGLEKQIQKHIDNAIEVSGGAGWKDFLSKFSAAFEGARSHEARAREAKIIAASVKSQRPAELAREELPKIPTLLHRPMMFINFGFRTIGRDANDPLVKRLANDMQDPDKFAELLSRPLADPQRIAAGEILQRAATIGLLRARQED